MVQVVVDVRDGVVIVQCQGQKRVLDRNETERFVINTGDAADCEAPDTEPWTPFAEAGQTFLDGKETRSAARVYVNNLYTVHSTETSDGATHLSVRANDRRWRHDWRHLQRIKNELCGPEREAVELYPAESRLVDEANQFHLWVAPPGVTIPVGVDARDVADGGYGWSDGARQRPRSEPDRLGRHGNGDDLPSIRGFPGAAR